MSKKKIPKRSKKRLIIFGIPCVAIIIYFIVQLGFYAYNIYNLNKELSHKKKEYTELKKDEKELRTEIDRLQDPDYIARYARENYSYSKNGEYIIKLNEEDEEKKEDESFITYVKNLVTNIDVDYQYIIFGAIGITILIMVIKSKKKED